jgi:hypothetical protein
MRRDVLVFPTGLYPLRAARDSGRAPLAALRLLILPTIALAVVAGVLPGRAGLAVRVYALVLCAVILRFAVTALRRAYPPTEPLRRAAARSRGRGRPASLARLEIEAALGVAGAFDLHHRLRPRLRRLAAGLVETRRRISLDGDPQAARAALGDTAWELVRHERPTPEDRLARGIPISELRSVVETLERT